MTSATMYEILKERQGINVLKFLYDQEFVHKTAHTISLQSLSEKLSVDNDRLEKSIALLIASNMVAKEDSGDSKGPIISLREKGRRFVEQFDVLRNIFFDKKEEPKFFKIDYSLTPLERRLLVLCVKMQRESASSISIRALAQEAYPHQDSSKTTGTVTRCISRLEGLNLLKKSQTEEGAVVDVTESGEKVVKNQLMEKPV